MEYSNVSVMSRVPLLDSAWASDDIEYFANAFRIPDTTLWRVRFIQQKGKGHLVCCMLTMYLENHLRFMRFIVGVGLDEQKALRNALRKLGQESHIWASHYPLLGG